MDYLVEHAIRNVWCNPEQDRQYRYRPHRLSPPLGDYRFVSVMGENHKLPNDKDKFHVYQIGALAPGILGLLPDQHRFSNQWIRVPDAMMRQSMWCEFYLDHGIQIPKYDIYYKYGIYQNLIFVIRENKGMGIDYGTLKPYMRVYSNAFFKSQYRTQNDRIQTRGMSVVNNNEILQLQAEINSLRALNRGYVFCYVNGYLKEQINVLTAKIGDSIEYVYDSSVVRVVSFDPRTLDYYLSELDNNRKYLLSYDYVDDQRIEYLDDNEIYVWDYSSGLNLHRHLDSTVRMVTHRDYGVSVDRIEYLLDMLGEVRATPSIRLYIRRSAYQRPLVFENSRIHELYKLPYSDRKRAMLSLDATMPLWNVSALENSPYTALMRSPDTGLRRHVVEEAYGYNASSVIIGNTPLRPTLESNQKRITLPIGQWSHSTAYEYSSDGLLLGYHHHLEGTYYFPKDNRCELVEMITGLGSDTPSVFFGTDNIPLPIGYSYRVYYSHHYDGLYLEDWVDITDTEYYRIENNILKWNNIDGDHLIMVRTDAEFLCYHFETLPRDGVIDFVLTEIEDRGNGPKHYTLPVPMGEIDIWLNGHSLIDGLDFTIDFPKVVIRNKDYLVLDTEGYPNDVYQEVTVRFTGFCTKDLTRQYFDDYGFITHGVMSRNNRFDIRDDRVLRIIYDGKTVHRDQVEFSENDSGVRVIDSRNGRPYAIRDIIVPMRNRTDSDTYDYRTQSRMIDKMVSDYLSRFLPEPDRNAPSSMTQRYPLYSPFISKVLYALKSELITLDSIDPLPDRMTIQQLCEPYVTWLSFDAIHDETVDHDYVVIHPHNHRNAVDVNYIQYRFLKAVVDLYAPGLVELSPYITIRTLKEQ